MSAKELNIADYVRTDKGEIGKLKDLKLDYTTGKRLVTYYTYKEVKENLVMFDNKKITQRFVDGSYIYLTNDELKNVEESIVKSSSNIIDLIEVGDYVNGNVVRKLNNELVIMNTGLIYDNNLYIPIKKIDIKSIVTKEQFEAIKYEIK